MHDTFNIFGMEVPAWGSMVSLGVLGLIGVMFYFFYKYNFTDKKIDTLVILIATCGMVMYVSAAFFDALWHNIDMWRQTGEFKWEWWGITFSGGLVGGVICYFILFFIFFKKERYNIFFYLDLTITGVTLTHAFGRIGCYLGGCCYGGETDSWFGVNYPVGTIFQNGQYITVYENVYPTQLFEAAFLFILFIVLFFFIKKNQLRYYLVSYGVFRFLIEYLRGDSRGASFISFLSPSQFLSVLMIILGIVLFFFQDKITNWLKKKFNPELLEA